MLVFAAAKVVIFFEIKKETHEIVLNKSCLPLRNKEKQHGHVYFQKADTPFTRQSDSRHPASRT